jgi:hypothetical protein
MLNGIGGLIVGLLIGIYVTASYSDSVIREFHKVGVPLIGQHAVAATR